MYSDRILIPSIINQKEQSCRLFYNKEIEVSGPDMKQEINYNQQRSEILQ